MVSRSKCYLGSSCNFSRFARSIADFLIILSIEADFSRWCSEERLERLAFCFSFEIYWCLGLREFVFARDGCDSILLTVDP